MRRAYRGSGTRGWTRMRQGCANLCEGLGSTPQNDAPRSGVCRVYGGSGGNVADCGEAGLSVAAAPVGQMGLVGNWADLFAKIAIIAPRPQLCTNSGFGKREKFSYLCIRE